MYMSHPSICHAITCHHVFFIIFAINIHVFLIEYNRLLSSGSHDIIVINFKLNHTSYSFREVAPYDIAILKLKTPFIFNKRVSAVTLPQQNEIRTGNAVLSGWGSISKKSDLQLPEVLQKATVRLLDNKSCLKHFLNLINEELNLYDTQICTATKEISPCFVSQINTFCLLYSLFFFLLHLIKLSY